MDPKKIGKRIYELRIKNNLTQKELADKLMVTSQAISKWENGRGIPDIEMLQKLSEIFEVDISEILTGNIKKRSKKLLFGLVGLGLVILIVIIFILIKVLSNDDFKISKLASDNDAFHVKGIIAYSNNKKSIYISQVDYSKEEKEKEYLNLQCILYEVNGDMEKKISECSSQVHDDSGTTFTLSELLKDVELNVDNYSCSCNQLVCNKLYLKINAINQDDETITYNIPIELESSCVKSN